MKQHWEFTTPMRGYKVSIYLTAAQTLLKTATKAPVQEVTLVELLSSPVLGAHAAVTKMFCYLCQHLPLPADAPEQAVTLYRFYKHFNAALMPERAYTWQVVDGAYCYTYDCRLQPYMWEELVTYPDGRISRNSAALLGHLLVWGPRQPAVPLTVRKELHALLCAVAPGSGLAPADAFPLIDHSALPTVRHEYADTAQSGEYVYMGKGYVCRGGWSDYGRQGGAYYVSPEQVLCNPELFISGEVPDAIMEDLRAKIRACLLPD
jgi:hypothetical protein